MMIENVKQELDRLKMESSSLIDNNIKFQVIGINDIQVETDYSDDFGDKIMFNILTTGEDSFTLTDKGQTIWNLQIDYYETPHNSNWLNQVDKVIEEAGFKIIDNKIFKDDLSMEDLPKNIATYIQLLIKVTDLPKAE